jgi:hypothetical protein
MPPNLESFPDDYFDRTKSDIEKILGVKVGAIIDAPHSPKSSKPCNFANKMKVGAIGINFIEGTSLAVPSATLYCNCGQSATLTSEGITLNENRF